MAFYNYNTPANGDLRKSIMILNRFAVGGQNQFRFMDGDNSQLCGIAAANYYNSFSARSPLAQYAEDSEREVDLVKVIEGLLRRVGSLEVDLQALRRPQ